MDDHAGQVAATGQQLTPQNLERLARLARERGEPHILLAALETLVALSRERVASATSGVADLGHLAAALIEYGDALLDQDQAPPAQENYEEALRINRHLATADRTPESERRLGVSLERAGAARAALGDLVGALDIQTECLALAHRLLADGASAPTARQRLANTLEKIGDLRQQQADTKAAMDAYSEALEVRRGLLTVYGEVAPLLRDISRGLLDVGDMLRLRGDGPGALTRYNEGVVTARRALAAASAGGTDIDPTVPRALFHALSLVGNMRYDQGDVTGALDSYDESLKLVRWLRTEYGEHPTVLRDLSVGLDKVAGAKEATGDLLAASDGFEEALSVERRRRQLVGDRAEVVRDLVWALEQVARVRAAVGDTASAQAAGREALALRDATVGG
jgi:tetratricopeptide (TPR) repeat protein